MAYRLHIVPSRCPFADCSGKATFEVFNQYNGSIGKYCGAHAKQKEDTIQRMEDKERAAKDKVSDDDD